MVSRHRELLLHHATNPKFRFRKSLFRRDAETNTRDACATQNLRFRYVGTTAPVWRQHVWPAIFPLCGCENERIPRLDAIRPFRLANAIGERLHRLHRVYQRIPVEPAIC